MQKTDNPLTQLHRLIVDRFSLDELKTLCFDLGVKYDDLSGKTLSGKVRELLLRLGQQRQLDRLINWIAENRPDVAGLSTNPTAVEELYNDLQYYETGKAKSEVEALLEEVEELWEKRCFKDAAKALHVIYSKHPELTDVEEAYLETLYSRAVQLEVAGELDEAKESYEKIIKINPHYEYAQKNLNHLLKKIRVPPSRTLVLILVFVGLLAIITIPSVRNTLVNIGSAIWELFKGVVAPPAPTVTTPPTLTNTPIPNIGDIPALDATLPFIGNEGFDFLTARPNLTSIAEGFDTMATHNALQAQSWNYPVSTPIAKAKNTPVPTPRRANPPTLTYPPPVLAGVDIITCNVTLEWHFPKTLAENEYLVIRIGKLGIDDYPSNVSWLKEYSHTYTFSEPGEYYWEVAICRGDPSTGVCEDGSQQLSVSAPETFTVFENCSSRTPTPQMP